MRYKIIAITGKQKTTLAEVISEAWANTFAEEVRKWIKANGGNGVTKVVVEEI